jgi:hypothetical protein
MAVAGTFTQKQNERYKAALQQDSPYEFAKEEVRRLLEQGRRANELKRSVFTSVGGGKRNGYKYEVARGMFTLFDWHGRWLATPWRMSMHRLIIDANYERLGCTGQPSLWEEATA